LTGRSPLGAASAICIKHPNSIKSCIW
jgi:hypothetical protein